MKFWNMLKKLWLPADAAVPPKKDFSAQEAKLQEVREHLSAAANRAEKAGNLLRELVREKGLS